MPRYISLLAITFLVVACQSKKNQQTAETVEQNLAVEIPYTYPTTGKIERLDDAINQIIAKDANIEILAEGFTWSEGPVWVGNGNFLLFSDVPENTVYKWEEKNGKSIYLQPSGYTSDIEREEEKGSNGLILNPDGQLVLCQHGDRRVAIMNAPLNAPKPDFTTLISHYDEKKLNSPNDVVYHENGNLYFTDPPYGLPLHDEDTAKELKHNGVYKVDKQGKITLLTSDLTRPNGLAFSHDYKKLYVAVSDKEKPVWMVYEVKKDGTLENGAVFFDASPLVEGRKGLPDGLKVAKNGTLFATGPGGVLIFDPSGKHLGTINTGEATANCAFGNNGQYLYMTADMYLMRVKLL